MSARVRVGVLGRPHGVRGAMTVRDVSDVPGRFFVGAHVWLDDELPAIIVEVRGQPDRPIVRLEGVETREAAEELRGCSLWAERVALPEGTLIVPDLIGARLIDTDGIDRGRVVAVEANPASELLVLEGGGLVPSVFITDVGDGYVVAELPPGLLES